MEIALRRRTRIGVVYNRLMMRMPIFVSRGLVLFLFGAALLAAPPRRLAVSFDDPNLNPGPLLKAEERNAALLKTLAETRLQAALFVCGMRVDSPGGLALVRSWGEAGHLVGSHGYDHGYLHAPEYSLEKFRASLERNQALLASLPGFVKRFRFPFLKEGDTPEKRDGARRILAERGYLSGGVSIDASDWYFDQRLKKRLETDPRADLAPYRSAFLAHIRRRAEYYQELSEKLGRPGTRHVLLLHHSLLNALFLGDLLKMFRELGWELVDAGEAFRDPVYAERPGILPAGESVIWALAREKGMAGLRYPGEDGEYEREELDRLGL